MGYALAGCKDLLEKDIPCGASSHHPLSPPPLSTLARAERGAEQPYLAACVNKGECTRRLVLGQAPRLTQRQKARVLPTFKDKAK